MGALGSGGAPALGLAPLGSFLWSDAAIGSLAGAAVDNRHLLDAVRHLCLTRDADARVVRPVDYRNLGAEELGSVYESLLELHAEVDVDARTFELRTAAGNERKTTGSYYTPSSLIDVLLDSALDPVLDEAERSGDPESALLTLTVLDPAAGSGHFLIAAAHRIAGRLAAVRSGGVEPAPDEVHHALRDVIGHCLYGIDVNPMAVELCKVSLWLEAMEPGRPLSFLDHHIVCGNSLLGTTPSLVAAGVPDEAFKAIEGDDKKFASVLRKTNKKERTHANQGMFSFGTSMASDMATMAGEIAALEALGDDELSSVAAKEARYAEMQASAAAQRTKLAADAWCAAFVAPKVSGNPLVTDAVIRQYREDPALVPADIRALVADLTEQYQFLHLHVAFPDVFEVPDDPATATNDLCGWTGGFDAVLGNPPWERVKLQEKEWFAARDPEIAAAPNAAARKRLIEALTSENPEMHRAFLADLRRAEGESTLLRNSGRYPLAGRGDVNTYAAFAELMRNAISPTGRVGVIVPTGIATDDTLKHFFSDLVDRRSLVSLFDFENRTIFPGVHRSFKFSLLTLSGDDRPVDAAEFVFFALDVIDLSDPEKRFTLAPEDFALLNPNNKTCPIFRTRRDAEITKGIYHRVPVLIDETKPDDNPWGIKFSTMFHMSNDSHLFRTREELEAEGWTLEGNRLARDPEQYLPLYEGRLGYQYDHRYAMEPDGVLGRLTSHAHADPGLVVEPHYWISEAEFSSDAPPAWLGIRRVARNTDERTVIASIIPPVPVSYGWILSLGPDPTRLTLLLATYNSFAFDYTARNSLSQPSFPQSTLAQLPAPPPSSFVDVTNHLVDAVTELTYTAWDLQGFAHSVGHSGPPFQWDEERRALLRAELDALMFHVYGIERDDVDYIMETFPIVKRKDVEKYDEYRTKRLILERYDAMAEAEAAGREYETMLDPPPAHPSLAHPESTRPSWAKRPEATL